MLRSLVWVVVMFLSLLTTTSAAAQLRAETIYRRGVNLYQHGDYKEAAETFKQALEPPLLTDLPIELIKKARVYRGICLFLLDDPSTAEGEFFQVLLLDPEDNLDPLFTPPNIIEFFDDLRRRRASELAKLRRGNVNPRTGRRDDLPSVPSASGDFLLTLTPFGIGQLHNKQRTKGLAILGTESVLLAANITTFALLSGMENPDGSFPENQIARAQVYKAINLTTFGLLMGAILYGIVDALWYRYVRVQPAEPDMESTRRRPSISLSVVPGPARGQSTLGLKLQFQF